MEVAILRYNAGNTFSVDCALKRLGIEAKITSDKEELLKADKIIFPGVGEAAMTMQHLKENHLDTFIKEIKQPFLGICLGMQVMCRYSEESGVECLNIFDVDVKKFLPQSTQEKVPHMGWNTLKKTKSDLFKDFGQEEYVYFVHSYYVPVNPFTIAQTEYINPFSAAIRKDNFYATQFHPEKSSSVGERILRNFLEL